MRYTVKWTDNKGCTQYGIVQYDSRPDKKGCVKVDDAVMPYYHLVPEKDLVDIEVEHGKWDQKTGEWVDQDEFNTYVSEHFKKAQALSDSLPGGVQVGSLFSIGVADGSAWYVVTKVGRKNVEVEWRGYCPDRYVAQIVGMGGSFPKSSIEPLCRRRGLFRKKQTA